MKKKRKRIIKVKQCSICNKIRKSYSWYSNNICANCYIKDKNQRFKNKGKCKKCGSIESISWHKNYTICNSCNNKKLHKKRKLIREKIQKN